MQEFFQARFFKSVQKLFFLLAFIFIFSTAQSAPPFEYQISEIPGESIAKMEKYTWRPGCPVPLAALIYLRLSYWGFDGQAHKGILVVNKQVAQEVVDIFHELYDAKFPIERMEPMEVFKGSDEEAMSANNTSAFNCRAITGKLGTFSMHSYGCTVDVNTLINPYVKGDLVLPPTGKAYLNRSKPVPGMIIEGDKTYQAFIKRGWTWGGSWTSPKDYQHFQKDCRGNQS